MKRKLNRRSFLRSSSTGISTVVGLPLLESMFGSSAAFADAPGAHPRFFSFYVPNGIIEESWYPSGGSKTNFNLGGTALEAFQDKGLKNDISLYRGMKNVADGHPGGCNAHMIAVSSWLTGKRLNSDDTNTHVISLDQELAEVQKGLTVHSMQWAGNSELDKPNGSVYFNPLKNALNWNKNGRILPLKSELRTEFDKLYAGLNADPNAGLDRRDALKISVLDDIKEDRDALLNQLGADDAQRMDRYFESLRDVEQRLDTLAENNQSTCTKPNIDNIPNPTNGDRNDRIVKHAELAAKIAAQAFACGLTHSITYAAGGEAAGCHYKDVEGINEHFHNNISHNRNGKKGKWETIDKTHGELCAQFMLEMKNTPHGAGNLLDGTAVLFGSGLGNGDAHSKKNIALMVGGHFGNWEHGRYHTLNGRNHADLIETLRVQMGLGKRYNRNTVPIS